MAASLGDHRSSQSRFVVGKKGPQGSQGLAQRSWASSWQRKPQRCWGHALSPAPGVQDARNLLRGLMTESAECAEREAAACLSCTGAEPAGVHPVSQVPAVSRFAQDRSRTRASSLTGRPHCFCWGLCHLWLPSQCVWSCGFVFVIPLSSYPHPSD